MSNPDGQNEPSMEEILASIRRIISEDDKEQKGNEGQERESAPETAESEFPEDAPEEDILDLTEKADDTEETVPDPIGTLEEAGSGKERSETPTDISAEAEEFPGADRLQDEAAMETAQQPEDTMMEQDTQSEADETGVEEGLVSRATAAATVAALSEASRDIRNQARVAEDLPIQSDKTLEGLVREAVKPLLKEWLDQNLAPLVERVVREEVRRLARRVEDD